MLTAHVCCQTQNLWEQEKNPTLQNVACMHQHVQIKTLKCAGPKELWSKWNVVKAEIKKKKKESSVILAYNEQSECQGCWIHQTPTAHSEYSERFSCDKCVIKNDFEPPRIPTHHARWREQSIFVFPSVCVCVLSVQLWQWDEMSALITAPLTSALIVCDRMGC